MPARKTLIPFAAVDCCVLFCDYNGLIDVRRESLAQQSLISWVLVSGPILKSSSTWLGEWGFDFSVMRIAVWKFCCSVVPKDSWKRRVFFLSLFFFPFLHGGNELFLPLPSPRSLLMLSLDLCLSLYFSALWKFLFVWPGVWFADHIVSEGPVLLLGLAMLGGQLGYN